MRDEAETSSGRNAHTTAAPLSALISVLGRHALTRREIAEDALTCTNRPRRSLSNAHAITGNAPTSGIRRAKRPASVKDLADNAGQSTQLLTDGSPAPVWGIPRA